MTTPDARHPQFSRRRMLQTMFCSSAMLALNLTPRVLRAADVAGAGDLHWLAIGDYGNLTASQGTVAKAMSGYLRRLKLKPDGLLLVGDNFYGKMEGGVQSERWKTGFEQMYPRDVFPGPCPAVLGNHDYGDNLGGEKTQIAYTKTPGTRWVMPSKWYRMEFPRQNPVVTFLFIDSNVVPASEKATGKDKPALTAPEIAEQYAWLEKQLSSKRAAWTIVVGHHPVYSNGVHGDTKPLVTNLAPILQKHAVPLYLCGHDHDMQHLELEGLKTSFVVSGGGGAKPRALKTPDRKLGVYGQSVNGFTHMQVNAQRILIRHLDVDGKQIHAFEKHPDGSFTLEKA